MKHLLLVLFFALAGCASKPVQRSLVVANPEYGSFVNPTEGTGVLTNVVVIPQWHLAAAANTKVSSAGLPQTENQRAIYRQLVDWAENGSVRTVIVEGCEGEMTDGFPERFNGWTLGDLQHLSAERLDNTLTHVGLKLKAKLGRKVRVVCGDSNELVKKHQLILSDLRGLIGFRIRIDEYKNDIAKRADYVLAARDLLKLPEDADEIDVLTKIDEELRAKVAAFRDVLHQRNMAFVVKALAEKSGPATGAEAIVIGAIHVDDLEKQLEDAHLATATFTPRGLKGDEAELLAEIETLLAKPVPTRAKAPRTSSTTNVGDRPTVKAARPAEAKGAGAVATPASSPASRPAAGAAAGAAASPSPAPKSSPAPAPQQ